MPSKKRLGIITAKRMYRISVKRHRPRKKKYEYRTYEVFADSRKKAISLVRKEAFAKNAEIVNIDDLTNVKIDPSTWRIVKRRKGRKK